MTESPHSQFKKIVFQMALFI